MAISDLKRFFLNQNVPYVKPFYSIDYENDDDVLSWISNADAGLTDYYQPLFREQKNNLRIFIAAGINPNFTSPITAAYLQQGIVENSLNDLQINEMYLLVQEQVSTVVSNELTAQVVPNNDDYQDKVAAKFVKMWLDSMSYDLSIDNQRVKWEMQKKVFGEAFVVPKWNPDKGDIHPDSKELKGEEEIEARDEEGNLIRDKDGKVKKIGSYQRVGDIELVNPLPFQVVIDPKDQYDQSDWFYYVTYEDVELLRKNYPDLVWNVNENSTKFDPLSGNDKGMSNLVEVYHFYHRAHKFVPEGRHIVATKEHVLVNDTLESMPSLVDSAQLPLVRFVDLDIGTGVRGIPILFRNGRPIVDGYNIITNQMYKNLEAESPILMLHETTGMDAKEMPNGIKVFNWRGNIKPTVETPSTNTSSIFKFREDLKRNIIEAGQQTPMQRGGTPNAQLDSFIALQHFEDLRVQQAAPDIKDHIKAIERLYKLMIAIASDHYEEGDQRLIKIVGRNNVVNIQKFDPENFMKVYDVKITTTGNLANSKAARTQLMLTIKREFPNMISDEVFVDMLGLSASEKFQNAITVAVNSAESENDDMLNGFLVDPPERYEDLITHWDIHRIPLQSQEYKKAPQEIKDLLEGHMTATEKLMFEQMVEDPIFASRVQGLRQFPLFYSPQPLNEISPQQEQAALQTPPQLPPDETIMVERQDQPMIPDREESNAIPEPVGAI